MQIDDPLSPFGGRDSLAGQAERAYVRPRVILFEEKKTVVLPKRADDGIKHCKMPPQGEKERIVVFTMDAERTVEATNADIEIRPQLGTLVQPASSLAIRIVGSAIVRITSFVAVAHRLIITPTGLVLDFEPIAGANCEIREGLLVSAYHVHEVGAEDSASGPKSLDMTEAPQQSLWKSRFGLSKATK